MAGNKKILLKKNVYEAAKDRIRWLFDEFENVIVGVSGGKDSTVVVNLAIEIAKEKGRLPLKIMFLDQEAEWMSTIENIRELMSRPEVDPIWLQIPFKLFNATSFKDHWLQCWNPDDAGNWIREKESISRKENVYGTERFGELFERIIDHEFGGQKACYIAGVRAEESPRRASGLSNGVTYKGITWGKKLNERKQQFTFYPIYDWSYTDVWKAIHDNQWVYNIVYDKMYQYGVPIQDMRVSNLHHETAVRALFILQEEEPETYNKVTARLAGVDMAGKMAWDDFGCPKDLPYMFSSWKEYRDHLLENLIESEEWKTNFRKKFIEMEEEKLWYLGDKLYRLHINSILTNDWEFVKLNNVVVPKELWPEYQRRRNERSAKRKAEKLANGTQGTGD